MNDRPAEKIRFINLAAQVAEERKGLLACVEQVLVSGMHIGGAEVDAVEREIATYLGAKEVVSLNSGTDALSLGMIAAGIKPGDEVITPPNSFVASAATIAQIGARPVFADVGWDGLFDPAAVEAAVTPRTVAIMPVHLWGGVCDMDALWRIADKHKLLIVEDAAQAMGSAHRGRRCGTLGTVGCFSTHPLKIFNACGDGGFVATNDPDIARRLRLLRNHGLIDRETVTEFAFNSRLDPIQAAILRFRLPGLDQTIVRRRANAQQYRELLAGAPIRLPVEKDYEFNTCVNFVSQCERRDRLQEHLTSRNIESAVHYRVPLHLQPATASLGYKRGQFPVTERLAETILTLPINQSLTRAEITYIAAAIREVLVNDGV